MGGRIIAAFLALSLAVCGARGAMARVQHVKVLDERRQQIGHVPVRADRLDGTYYNTVSDEVVTPHVNWGRPLAGGALRVLFIVPRHTAREVIELKQRFDVAPEAVLVENSGAIGADNKYSLKITGTSIAERTAALREAVRARYDAIVIGLFRWSLLPGDVRSAILGQVRGGAGLVIVYPMRGTGNDLKELTEKPTSEGRTLITSAFPFRALDAFGGREGPQRVVETYEVGRGRVALLDYEPHGRGYYRGNSLTPTVDLNEETLVHYEYYQSLLARTLLWASRRAPAVRVERIEASVSPLPAGHQAPGQAVARVVNDSGKTVSCRVLWHFRNAVEPIVSAEVKIELAPGEKRLAFELPAAPEGGYFVDLIVSSQEGILHWGSASVRYEADVGLKKLELSRPSYERGEQARVSVWIDGEADPRRHVIRASIMDGFGRVLRETEAKALPATGQPMVFTLPVGGEPHTWRRVRVSLFERENPVPLCSAEAGFPVPRRDPDRFFTVFWEDVESTYLGRLFFRAQKAAGLNTVDGTNVKFNQSPEWLQWASRFLARLDLELIPYITRIVQEPGSTRTVRKPCLTDPGYVTSLTSGLRRAAKALAPVAPPAYTLGDENFLATGHQDFCFSPTCQAGFRQWLRGRYRSLAELNRRWRTDYKRWDDVSGITLAEARQKGRCAHWVEFRTYMDHVFVDIHRKGIEAIHAEDPQTRVGFDGAYGQSSFRGYDWEQIGRLFALNGCYPDPHLVEVIRSLARRDAMLSIWHGGYVFWQRSVGGANLNRTLPWWCAFQGTRSLWLFNGSRGHEAIFAPDLRPIPSLAQELPDIKELSEGVGRLLNVARRIDDDIAIRWSRPCLHVSTYLDQGVSLPATQAGWQFPIQMTGRQVRYVGRKQIEDGALKDFRALILPGCYALSGKEASRIEAFVMSGGVVLADIPPGHYDEGGLLREGGRLDALFGIKSPAPAGKLKALSLSVPAPGEAALVLSGQYPIVEDVSLTDGEALGKMGEEPLLVVARRGRGAAVLLNFVLTASVGVTAAPVDEGLVRWMDAMLNHFGLVSHLPLTRDGKPYCYCQAFSFSLGGAELLGLVRHPLHPDTGPHDVTVHLPGKRHVYDVRARRYLGFTDVPQVRIMAGRPVLISMLPYRVTAVKVDVERNPGRGQPTAIRLQVLGSEGRVGCHVLRLDLVGPAGNVCEWFGRNLTARGGSAQVSYRPALNDPAGTYTLKVRDVLSGVGGAGQFTLR